MSLILFEGFEDLGSWYVGNGTPTITTGRNGSAVTGAGNTWIWRQSNAADEYATFIAGCAVKYTTMPISASGMTLLSFASDAGVTNHTYVGVMPNGGLVVERAGTPTTLNTTAGGLIVVNTWYYIEFKCTLGDSAAAYDVRLNGTSVLSGSGDTKNGGTKVVYDSLRVGTSGSQAGTYVVDDLYWLNTAGSTSNNYFGDLAVETLYPESMDTTAWLGSDGNTVDNNLLVDEPGAPSMTDYVYSSTVAARELYRLTNTVRTSGTVHGVTAAAYANKSDSGARGLKLVVREFAGAQRTSADYALTTTPTTYTAAWDRKNDGSVWTILDINGTTPANGMSAGIEVGS